MLKARALLAQNDYEASEPVLAKLREDYSETSFAQRSFLLEASFHYHRDDLVRAQQLSVNWLMITLTIPWLLWRF